MCLLSPVLSEVTAHEVNVIVVIPLLILSCITGAAMVISARRNLRKQRIRAQELAQSIQQIRDETRRRLLFLNALSHDLRTPLNRITLQSHIIQQALLNNDAAILPRAAEDIRTSSTLAGEILGSLLQYAQTAIDENVISPVNLHDLLEQTAEPFRAAAEEKKLAFSVSTPHSLIVHTDPAKLQRIISSLLSNAVKFTPQGSVALRAKLNHAGVIIDVTDTGPGLTEDERSHVFHEFFQANNPSRDARLGLGLGLVIAHRLAQQLSATLTCSSPGPPQKDPTGSTFTLTLPLNSPPTK